MKKLVCLCLLIFNTGYAMEWYSFSASKQFFITSAPKPRFITHVAYACVSLKNFKTSLLLFRTSESDDVMIERYIKNNNGKANKNSATFYTSFGRVFKKSNFEHISENELLWIKSRLDPDLFLSERTINRLLKNTIRVMDGESLEQMIAMIMEARNKCLVEGEC